MAKMVGLARPLKIEWLNKTVDLTIEGRPVEEIQAELNEFLSFEINSSTTLRKTRESLINIWIDSLTTTQRETPSSPANTQKDSPAAPGNTRQLPINIQKDHPEDKAAELRRQALSIYPTLQLERSLSTLPVHWCMIQVTYPIFADICALIGKISMIEETFTTAWIREKLYESWGERTTLDVPVKNILRTLIDFEAIEKVKTGVYKIRQISVTDDGIKRLFIKTILALKQRAYYEITDLSYAPQLFPFVFDVSHEWLHNMGCFSLGYFGGKTVLTD